MGSKSKKLQTNISQSAPNFQISVCRGSQHILYPELIQSKKVSWTSPLMKKTEQDAPNRGSLAGIILAILSGIFFTLCATLVKYLDNIDPMELLVVRSIIQVGVSLPIAVIKCHNILGPEGSRILMLSQGIVGGLTLVTSFYSFRLLPLGDASAIIFCSPIFVLFISRIVLNEACGLFRIFVVFVLTTAVVLITKPSFLFGSLRDTETNSVAGYAFALGATLATAINFVFLRKCRNVHYSVVVFQFSFWSAVMSSTIFGVVGEFQMPGSQWGLVLLMAAFGVVGQILLPIALAYEEAGRVAVVRSLDVVLAYALQAIVFGDVPDWRSVVGGAMVLISVILMGLEDIIHRYCFYKYRNYDSLAENCCIPYPVPGGFDAGV